MPMDFKQELDAAWAEMQAAFLQTATKNSNPTANRRKPIHGKTRHPWTRTKGETRSTSALERNSTRPRMEVERQEAKDGRRKKTAAMTPHRQHLSAQ